MEQTTNQMSIKDKITPGSWEQIYELNVQAKESGRAICSCGRNSSELNNHDQNVANAKLIAASPEMLSIIERLAKYYSWHEDQPHLEQLCKDAEKLLNELNK